MQTNSLLLRLGLCCIFREAPIKFRTTTARAIQCLNSTDAAQKLSSICESNAQALLEALQYCAGHKIGCFRITSPILPLKTHPVCGYRLQELPNGKKILRLFRDCGDFARQSNIRTVFHPDQFILLNSPRPDVVENSLRELEYQAEIAEWVGADVINIHGGGAYGNKAAALQVLEKALRKLPKRIKQRLTLENDDKIYTPADLLPICRNTGIPLVYDIHHHRCCPDEFSENEITSESIKTWNREPLFHISSPLFGWSGKYPERHHDFIDVNDFPLCWLNHSLTVEVEAKAKELAIARLQMDLQKRYGLFT